MKLEQISYIKQTFKGLKMRKERTSMFTNKDWASGFVIDYLTSHDLDDLSQYCYVHDILYFISQDKIYFQ